MNLLASARQTFNKLGGAHDEDAPRAARDERGDDGQSLDRLAEAGLVREHAAAPVPQPRQHPGDAEPLVLGQLGREGLRRIAGVGSLPVIARIARFKTKIA